MPARLSTKPSNPPMRHWVPPPVTKEDLQWADLTCIDIAKAKTPEGRAEQVRLARDATHKQGFFYVINHGLDQAIVDRMVDIAALSFDDVSENEKLHYQARIKETGEYLGYKLPQYWTIANGVKDKIEHYNIPRDASRREHPNVLRPFLPEVQRIIEFTHRDVLNEVQKLLSLGLELPENTLPDLHPFDETNHSFCKQAQFNPRTQEEEEKTNNIWMKGHADHMSFTAIWSQPVTALQIKDWDGKWRYVRHVDNALVVNCGDTTEYLSGGYYKSAIHRVVKPPADQEGYRRLGLIYFNYMSDHATLAPLLESPVLQREGVTKSIRGDPPTQETWRKTRTAAYGVTRLQRAEDGSEYEVINGVRVTHYN
ncbi:Clavaminate synthase-like protein [Russula vinacea]|nr:Clavaminate synthase-like protein [Russula vinacea]